MVFLPLFTMYLALAARLHTLLAALALHHAKRLQVLRSSLLVREAVYLCLSVSVRVRVCVH
jgi:hypothetical protein